MSEDLPLWQARARKRIAEKREAEKKESFESDLVPEAPFERSDEDKEMDRIIDGTTFWDIYNKYVENNIIGKKVGGEVQISCPVPGHVDRHPSASVTPDGVWKCHGICDTGGDKLDIAAMHYGMSNYKDGANFHELRRKIAEDFGYTITRTAGVTIVTPPEPAKPKLAVVTSIVPDDDDEDLDEYRMDTKGIPWRDFVDPETPLGVYMNIVSQDDLPEEFHFYSGMTGINVAIGHDARLLDSKPVSANMNVCMVGPTGSGKSQATSRLYDLLGQAFPYNPDPSRPCGVNIFTPSSGEAIFDELTRIEPNPANPKSPGTPHPVTAIADFNELRDFVGKGARLGNTLKDTVMALSDNNTATLNQVTRGRGRIEIVKPFFCILTTTQPGSLPALLSESDVTSGLVNRIVLVPGVHKQRFAINRQVIDMTPAVLPFQRLHGWAASLKGEFIDYSPDAEKLWTEFFHDEVEKTKAKNPNVLGRLDLTMKKYMLVMAANRMEKAVSLQSVQDAIQLYNFTVSAYTSASEHIITDHGTRGQREHKIIGYIERALNKYGDVSAALIKTNYLKRDKSITVKEITDTLDVLVKAGMLESFKANEGGRGRPAVKFRKAE